MTWLCVQTALLVFEQDLNISAFTYTFQNTFSFDLDHFYHSCYPNLLIQTRDNSVSVVHLAQPFTIKHDTKDTACK